MKHLITALIAIICIVAGGFGGHFLKTSSASGSAPAASASASGEVETAEPAADTAGKPDSKSDESSGEVIYYKFSREFVVPLLEEERVESLVILNINLEVDAAHSQDLFKLEPKLRDNIMTTLIQLSNDGNTFQTITDVDSYETVRAMVLMNLKNVLPEGVRNVLILDMAKQNL